jgi:hypothetical protein
LSGIFALPDADGDEVAMQAAPMALGEGRAHQQDGHLQVVRVGGCEPLCVGIGGKAAHDRQGEGADGVGRLRRLLRRAQRAGYPV